MCKYVFDSLEDLCGNDITVHSISHTHARFPNGFAFAIRTRGMAAAASVPLRRLASGPGSENAARIRMLGGGMPSETLGPRALSFRM